MYFKAISILIVKVHQCLMRGLINSVDEVKRRTTQDSIDVEEARYKGERRFSFYLNLTQYSQEYYELLHEKTCLQDFQPGPTQNKAE